MTPSPAASMADANAPVPSVASHALEACRCGGRSAASRCSCWLVARARRGLGAGPARAEPAAARRRARSRRALGHGHRRARRPRRADDHGADQADVARALGFVHAQDRFFQMDLARRRAAGELSELIGAATRDARRADARAGVPPPRADGSSSRRRPTSARSPAPTPTASTPASRRWAPCRPSTSRCARRPSRGRPRTASLVLASMFLQLQDAFGVRETAIGLALRRAAAAARRLRHDDGERVGDAAVRSRAGRAGIPGADVFDLRGAPSRAHRRSGRRAGSRADARRSDDAALMAVPSASRPRPVRRGGSDALPGSNNWAVAARTRASRGAIVANDMHLGLGVPNIWYRASMAWTTPAGAPRDRRDAARRADAGRRQQRRHRVGLHQHDGRLDRPRAARRRPGEPLAGTARRRDGSRSRSAQGGDRGRPRDADVVEVRETIWGPVIEPDARGRQRAVAWVPLRDGGLNFAVTGLETAATIEDAFDVGAQAGMPAQNLVVGERDGRIGWSVAGRIPRRVGFDGTRARRRGPTARAAGTAGWRRPSTRASIDPAVGPHRHRQQPRRRRRGTGRHSATAATTPARARARSPTAWLGVENATTADMLHVQLDDRALFLDRWRTLLLQVLGDPRAAADRGPARAAPGGRRHVDRPRVRGLGGVPARARVPAEGRGTGVHAAVRRGAQGGPDVPARRRDGWARGRSGPWCRRARRTCCRRSSPRGRTCCSPPPIAPSSMPGRPSGSIDGAHVGTREHRAHPAPAVACRAAAGAVARPAARGAARRLAHAARAGAGVRGVGAVRGDARARVGGLLPHAGRAERPPAVAALPRRAPRVGRRRAHAVPAGTDAAHADAETVRPGGSPPRILKAGRLPGAHAEARALPDTVPVAGTSACGIARAVGDVPKRFP